MAALHIMFIGGKLFFSRAYLGIKSRCTKRGRLQSRDECAVPYFLCVSDRNESHRHRRRRLPLQSPTHPMRPTAIATTNATVLPSLLSLTVPAAPVALALVPVAVFVPPERFCVAVPIGLTSPAVLVVDSGVTMVPTLVTVSEEPLLVLVMVVAMREVSGVLVLTVMVAVSVGVDVSEVGMVKPVAVAVTVPVRMVRDGSSVVRVSETMRLMLLLLMSSLFRFACNRGCSGC